MVNYGAVLDTKADPPNQTHNRNSIFYGIITISLLSIIALIGGNKTALVASTSLTTIQTPHSHIDPTDSIDTVSCGVATLTKNGDSSCSWTDSNNEIVPPKAWDNAGHFVNFKWNGKGIVTPDEADLASRKYTNGEHKITFTAIDEAGNTAKCFRTVVVLDTDTPTATNCTASAIEVVADGSCQGTATLVAPTFTDTCEDSLTETDDAPDDGVYTMTSLGNKTFTYSAFDGTNYGKCEIAVALKDETPPTFGTLVGFTEYIDNDNPDKCTNGVEGKVLYTRLDSEVTRMIEDNCDDNVKITYDPAISLTDETMYIGDLSVTVTATDSSGNDHNQTVALSIQDKTAPTISCPADISVTLGAEQSKMFVSWSETSIVIQDNVCGATYERFSDGLPTNGGLWSAGSYQVRYVVTDTAGITADCFMDIQVQDITAPVMTGCPTDTLEIKSLPYTHVGLLPEFSISARDAGEDANVPIVFDPDIVGNALPIGTFAVKAVAMDNFNNTFTCEFYVLVTDLEEPQFQPISSCGTGTQRIQSGIRDYAQCGGNVLTTTGAETDTGNVVMHTSFSLAPFSATDTKCCTKGSVCTEMASGYSACQPPPTLEFNIS